jgi:hypothetical protein
MTTQSKIIGQDMFFTYTMTDLGNGMVRMEGRPTELMKRTTELEKEMLRIRHEKTSAWLDSVMEETEYKKPKTVIHTLKDWLKL